MGRRSSYSGLNLAPLAPSSCSTASATATPPSPPFSHTSHNSTPTSSAAHSSRTAASSASLSDRNRLSATTAGPPNLFRFRMGRRAFGRPAPPGGGMGGAELSFLPPAVLLHRPPRRAHEGGWGMQPRHTALDVEEFLGPQVGTESRL